LALSDPNAHKLMLSDEWYNRLRGLIIAATKLISEAGGVISGVLSVFWPAKDGTMALLEEMMKEVAKMIDEAILKKEYEERQSDIEALKLTMTRYVNADIVNPKSAISWIP